MVVHVGGVYRLVIAGVDKLVDFNYFGLIVVNLCVLYYEIKSAGWLC